MTVKKTMAEWHELEMFRAGMSFSSFKGFPECLELKSEVTASLLHIYVC